MTGRVTTLFLALLVSAQADTLILRDGTHVTGRWWSADAAQIHFLVNNQLQHYPRADVSVVNFGSEAAAPTPPPAQPAKPPEAKPAPRTEAVQPAPASGASEQIDLGPVYIGAVYFRRDSGEVIPLEQNRATEHRAARTSKRAAKNGDTTDYFEMQGTHSPVRFKTGQKLPFVVRMAEGADPKKFSLFVLETNTRTRRTKAGAGEGVLQTVPFTVKQIDGTDYFLTPGDDLAPGEYAFSPEGSNDSYCFGIDPAVPGANQ